MNFLKSARSLPRFGSNCALALLVALISQVSLAQNSSPDMLKDSPKAVLDEAWQIVNRDYVDRQFNHVDWLQVRQTLLSQSYTSRAAAYTALKAALEKLNDRYTRFLTPEEFQALNSNDINGELTGVGLQLASDPHSKALIVVKAIAQSPALRAGVQPGDVILAIDGHPTAGMSPEQATNQIRGAEKTSVKLLFSRPQHPNYTLTLTRQRIELPIVDYALRQQGNQRIGYIRLDEFSGHAAEQMKHAIDDLTQHQADRFVLDLRGNPGGLLEQENAIARMWLNQGAIVRIVDRSGNSDQIEANHTALTNRPLAILVDGGSASASEIITGALKDNHRAVVIGTQTFGKALVQSVNPLSDGSGLNVTIAHYFTPAGLDINHRGITPDVVSPLTEPQQQELANHPDELGTDRDPQFNRAIATLSQL